MSPYRNYRKINLVKIKHDGPKTGSGEKNDKSVNTTNSLARKESRDILTMRDELLVSTIHLRSSHNFHINHSEP